MRAVADRKVDIWSPKLTRIEHKSGGDITRSLSGAPIHRPYIHRAWWNWILLTSSISQPIQLSPGAGDFWVWFICKTGRSSLKSRWTHAWLEPLLRRNLLDLHLIYLIRRVGDRCHGPSRSQGGLCYSTSSNVTVLVGLVIHDQLMPIHRSCSISSILQIASISKLCRLRIYRLWVVSAKVQLFEQFLFFLSLLLYDLASAEVWLKLSRADSGLLQRWRRWDVVSGLVEVGSRLWLRRQRVVMLNLVHWFSSVVVVHGMWKPLTHLLPLIIFRCNTCSSSTVVQLLAVDIIEYLHLTSFRSQAHLSVSIYWSLSCWIGWKVLGWRFGWDMLINTSIKHICLRISRPRIVWRHFNLIEIVVSIMIALGPSFM